LFNKEEECTMEMKVTERNIGNVMGKINKFLSKPTRKYVGKKMVQVGYENIEIFGENVKQPVYEERDTYVPFVGLCEEHYLRKEARKKAKEERRWEDNHKLHNCLLSISDNYETNCIPIMAGFTVNITGDRMIIKENDIYHYVNLFGKVSSHKEKDRSSYVYFYHMPISEEELKDRQVHAMHCGMDYLFESYYCGGSFYDYFDSDFMVSCAMDTMNIIQDMFENIFGCDEDELNREISVSQEINDKTVEVYCNAASFKEGIPQKLDDNIFIKVDGEKYYDIVSAVLKIVSGDDDLEDDYDYEKLEDYPEDNEYTEGDEYYDEEHEDAEDDEEYDEDEYFEDDFNDSWLQ